MSIGRFEGNRKMDRYLSSMYRKGTTPAYSGVVVAINLGTLLYSRTRFLEFAGHMTQKEIEDRIEKIRQLPVLVEAAVGGLSDAQLDTPYRDGGWTVRQVVHHLADSHLNAFVRMKLIITEDNPTLKTYDQEEWAKLPDYLLSVDASLSILRGLHGRWVALLNSVPMDGWSRSANHPESGIVQLGDLLTMYAKHGENHLGQITSLKSARNW